MDYVRKAEQVCRDLSIGKRMQFLQEQLQVREFQTAVESEDWEQALKMLRALEPASLSVKSRSFYLYYKKILKENCQISQRFLSSIPRWIKLAVIPVGRSLPAFGARKIMIGGIPILISATS